MLALACRFLCGTWVEATARAPRGVFRRSFFGELGSCPVPRLPLDASPEAPRELAEAELPVRWGRLPTGVDGLPLSLGVLEAPEAGPRGVLSVLAELPLERCRTTRFACGAGAVGTGAARKVAALPPAVPRAPPPLLAAKPLGVVAGGGLDLRDEDAVEGEGASRFWRSMTLGPADCGRGFSTDCGRRFSWTPARFCAEDAVGCKSEERTHGRAFAGDADRPLSGSAEPHLRSAALRLAEATARNGETLRSVVLAVASRRLALRGPSPQLLAPARSRWSPKRFLGVATCAGPDPPAPAQDTAVNGVDALERGSV